MSCSYFFRFVSASTRSVVCRKVCSPFLFCLLLLFLVLAAAPFTSSLGRLSSFPLPSSWMTPVSAAPVRPFAFSEPVGLAVGCDLCNHMVINLLIQIANALQVQNRTVATEKDVDTFLQFLCEPDNVGGAWIRRLAFFVVPDDPNDLTSPVHFEHRVLKDYTKCKRACVTLRDVCQDITEMPFFESLLTRVPAISKEKDFLTNDVAVGKLRNTVCGNMNLCTEQKKYLNTINELLNEPGSDLRYEMVNDRVETISPEELEAEVMMYETQKQFNADLFTREQITALRAAIARGDRHGAASIDKQINALSYQEFHELRMHELEESRRLEREQNNNSREDL